MLEEVPDRVIAHHDPALDQLRSQCPQRHIWLLGKTRQKPLALTSKHIRPFATHRPGRSAALRAEALRPLHHARNAYPKSCRNCPARLTASNRHNHALSKIQGIWSRHRCWPPIPASILNQTNHALGIPTRFGEAQSRSRSDRGASPHRRRAYRNMNFSLTPTRSSPAVSR